MFSDLCSFYLEEYVVCQACMHLPQPDNESDPLAYEETCLKCAGLPDVADEIIAHAQKCSKGGQLVSKKSFLQLTR
jgi:hypothetical protein